MEKQNNSIINTMQKLQSVNYIEEIKPSLYGSVLLPSENRMSHIKNKIVRIKKYQKLKHELKKVGTSEYFTVQMTFSMKRPLPYGEDTTDIPRIMSRLLASIFTPAKKEAKKQREREGLPKQKPHTLESLREKDETTVDDVSTDDNELIQNDLENDELSSYFMQSYEPKVLITYSDNPMQKTRIFGRELTRIVPNSVSLYRNRSGIKKIVKSANKNGFTDILVITEYKKQPDGLLLIHLPNGPTAHFKVSNVKITTEMRKSHKNITKHRPEVILNNFSTRLGLTIGRLLGALFHYDPEFQGRRAITFHNQRDYIFFRHYKYEFDANGQKARLSELGPRFTLKLKSLQKGTFDSKYGEYEWMIDGRRHSMETSRRRFFL